MTEEASGGKPFDLRLVGSHRIPPKHDGTPARNAIAVEYTLDGQPLHGRIRHDSGKIRLGEELAKHEHADAIKAEAYRLYLEYMRIEIDRIRSERGWSGSEANRLASFVTRLPKSE